MKVTGSKSLYIQVLIAVILGALLGHFYPELAMAMQPLGDAFIRLVKMVIAPIIFLTVVVGIAKLTGAAGVGRIGLKAILYFEVLTTIASADRPPGRPRLRTRRRHQRRPPDRLRRRCGRASSTLRPSRRSPTS